MRRITFGQTLLIGSAMLVGLGNASRAQLSKTRPAQETPTTDTDPQGQITSSSPLKSRVEPMTVPMIVPMTVDAGTPIKVLLDSDVRIREVGQQLQGKTTEPIYTFDKLLIPVGTLANGRVSAIDGVPKMVRTMQALNANFSPTRGVHVQFDELVMSDGRKVALHTVATPAPDGVLNFVAANEKAEQKNKVAGAAGKKVSATRAAIEQQWSDLQKKIHEPGKLHRAKRYLLAQSPVHPQYIDAGTSFNATLQEPLDFGTELVNAEGLMSIGNPPPTGSVVHARLATGLSSATAKKGDAVEAVITEPLIASNHLILPEGSVIKGSVVQVAPARRLGHNGQLRILFHEVAPPNGVEQRVETTLEGVAVAKGQHLKLDTEGGAQVTTPRSRYLVTGFQIALAAAQAHPDTDAGQAGQTGGDVGGGAVSGASGFKLVGMVVGIAARSRVVSAAFGSYGAALSIYYHFLARGRDVVYPKDMAMVVGMGTRDSKGKSAAGF